MEYMHQVRALKRWEFNYDGHFDVYRGEVDGVNITWSVTNQFGAYEFDGMVSLIYNWDELDEIMQQTVMY